MANNDYLKNGFVLLFKTYFFSKEYGFCKQSLWKAS